MRHPLASTSLSTLAAGTAIMSSMAVIHPVNAFTVLLDPSHGSTENTGSTARLDFSFVQVGSSVKLDLGLHNITNGATGLGATASTLVGVGFALPALIQRFSYNSSSSAFTQLYGDSSLNRAVLGDALQI